MFLRSNVRAAGLAYEGKPLQADYVGAFEGDRLVGVGAHCWNGMLLVQAPLPARVEDVACAAVARSSRPVVGLSGPWDQVVAARRALGLERRAAPKNSCEDLLALDLPQLVPPEPLVAGRWRCRHSTESDTELLTAWRVAFSREALGAPDAPRLRAQAREDIELSRGRGTAWVLEADGHPVATCVFNGQLPDIVQIGGVWTPPERRGRGYGRGVVAGSLLAARAAGALRAVLFVEPGNTAAIRAYTAIGFRTIGQYGLVLFAD
jgi:RimJ/RimL family protein N-acetyltransferase